VLRGRRAGDPDRDFVEQAVEARQRAELQGKRAEETRRSVVPELAVVELDGVRGLERAGGAIALIGAGPLVDLSEQRAVAPVAAWVWHAVGRGGSRRRRRPVSQTGPVSVVIDGGYQPESEHLGFRTGRRIGIARAIVENGFVVERRAVRHPNGG